MRAPTVPIGSPTVPIGSPAVPIGSPTAPIGSLQASLESFTVSRSPLPVPIGPPRVSSKPPAAPMRPPQASWSPPQVHGRALAKNPRLTLHDRGACRADASPYLNVMPVKQRLLTVMLLKSDGTSRLMRSIVATSADERLFPLSSQQSVLKEENDT